MASVESREDDTDGDEGEGRDGRARGGVAAVLHTGTDPGTGVVAALVVAVIRFLILDVTTGAVDPVLGRVV